MLAVTIEDLEVSFSDTNLLLEKNVIWFELLVQKEETSK